MNVLLLGSGGREHAIALALVKDPQLDSLTIAPGNPGTASLGKNVPINILDAGQVVDLARQTAADLVIIGPEAPLVAGIADALRAAGFAVFGPNQSAARLEGSKAFAKEIMACARVATAGARSCQTSQALAAALDEFGAPYVVKDDGLAAGKGVVVTADRQVAFAHGLACLENGEGGSVLVEEYLDGPEVSLFCFTDGRSVVPLPPAQDYKRVGDGNAGPNTGGMGAYSPLDWAPDDLSEQVVRDVAIPVVRELAGRGTPFVGLLYCGLALTSRGLKVVEFNARFGDPETQSVLARLDSSLLEALDACARGRLDQLAPLVVSPDATVTVVLAAGGYPGEVTLGGVISGVDQGEKLPGVHVIHAGTTLVDGQLRAAGGRVLAVVGRGSDLAQARARAYRAMSMIHLDGSHYRRDLAKF